MKKGKNADQDALGEARPDQAEHETAEATENADDATGEAKGAEPDATIGSLIRERLAAGDDYAAVVEAVRVRFPDARTTRRSVASVASRLRRAGVAVETRRPQKTGA